VGDVLCVLPYAQDKQKCTMISHEEREGQRSVFKSLLFRNCNFLVVVVYVYLISVSRARIKWMSFCYSPYQLP